MSIEYEVRVAHLINLIIQSWFVLFTFWILLFIFSFKQGN